MTPEIALATVDDLDDLARLFDEYRQFYDQPSDLDCCRTFLLDRIENRESIIFLARQDEAVGFAQIYPSWSSVSAARLWILNDLYVAPAYRGAGVGESLMRSAMEFGRATGACGMTLMTARDNHAAQRLYERLGWELDGEFLTYNLGPEH